MWIVLWDLFLMKKLIKNEICGSVNSTWMHCLRKTGQKLRLLFMYRTWTVPPVGGKGVKKKKRKGKRRNLKCSKRESKLCHIRPIKIWGVWVLWLRLERGKCKANKFGCNPRETVCALHSGQSVGSTKRWVLVSF